MSIRETITAEISSQPLSAVTCQPLKHRTDHHRNLSIRHLLVCVFLPVFFVRHPIQPLCGLIFTVDVMSVTHESTAENVSLNPSKQLQFIVRGAPLQLVMQHIRCVFEGTGHVPGLLRKQGRLLITRLKSNTLSL